MAAKVEDEDCWRDIGGRGCGDHVGVFSVELAIVDGTVESSWHEPVFVI